MSRPRRCPPCPACGADCMRQYGARKSLHVSRYFYACQLCEHTDVWREGREASESSAGDLSDRGGRWEKTVRQPQKPSDNLLIA